LEEQENWPEAAVAFRRAVDLSPETIWLYKKLGDALRKQGDWESAIAIYEKGINLEPKSCWCYEGLGLSLIAKQQWEPAITNLIQALQIKPDLFGIYYHIAYALEQKGEVDEADVIKFGHEMLPLSVIKKYCKFTEDLAITAESDPTITCIEIYPASQINLSDSKTIDTNSRCWEDEIFYIKKAFVAVLPNGRAWADIATIVAITSNNKLVTDISMGCPELVITSDKLHPAEHIEGNVAFLSARWGGAAYFHWMFDVITRFELLQRSGLIETIDKFVVNACDSSYEKETLNTLGIPQDKILESRYQPHITADKLIVPSICNGAAGTSKWKCEYLKRMFLNEKQSLKTDYSERIYISREKASYRRIVNEKDVIGCLEKFGFRTVKLETMSVAEQALCLAAAKVVVAPHGAGLTNLVFCNPGTKVIEIFAPIYVPICFWTISNLCDLEHYYLIAELFDDKTQKYPGHKDMRVDLTSLEKLMNLAGVLHE
ncbi:glycosyltransferase 61 family protein, partial [Microcoleus anatoxicus]